jgi:hypothetical protein
MNRSYRRAAAAVPFAALLCAASPASAQIAPSLGAAQSFAVLAATTVTNTGPSGMTGDVGVSPGSAVTGFPPGTFVSGSIHSADAAAAAAQTSALNAYNNLAGQACTTDLTGQDLGGKTLTAGVYCFSSSAGLTGILTLNAQNNPNAVFIFKMGTTITTASASSVVMINGGSLCNVFWQVGSSATLGTTTSFAGNILALTSITMTTGVSLAGRAIALNAAVTMDTNAVTATCLAGPPPPVCPAIALAPATLPDGTVGAAYSQTIVGSGGTAPYTFAVTVGAIPVGLSLTPAGVLAGTPTAAGSPSFTIRGTDANGCFASVAYTIIVAAAPPPPPVCPAIGVAPATLPDGTVGIAYSQTIVGSAGTAPYTFGVTAGALPTNLTLTAAGVLAGTPNAAGTSPFTIRGTDANGCFASVAYTIIIAAAPPPPPVCPVIVVAPATLPGGTVGIAYSQTILGSGGAPPYSFGAIAGALPAGVTLTAAGLLAGTPTTAGQSTVTIRGTDANACFASLAYTIAIAAAPLPPPACPTISLAPATLPNSTVGVAYSQTIVGSGGTAPYSFGVTAGALPANVTLTAAGVLAGTPTTPGQSIVTIRGTSANGCFAQLSFTMFALAAVPTLPQAVVILLGLGLAASGYLRLRQRGRMAPRR